ncbi:energy-coupling factor transporter transmembrane component T [Halostagnicola sp. A-GB9-2]|uniref:energy-coupling factor transporter transmembrane component T family protein n=1 Tax=Halostagnicola sp. A-GB9-2 TaxID=3048066 RepID=UPI0024BFFE63|nr:energy-coupling factor transporter transmembrane component T [Halostagnicola sp. A-GB9-2]MDJ1433535.1 energy-coupling factor transporter transmembrane component T [Halostagnicola sp. A-GB9-2]
MLTYEPDDTFAHRLDPRSKLAVQIGFAVTALAHTTPRALVVFTAFTILGLAAAGVPLWRALYGYRFALPILAAAPVISMLTIGTPWLVPADGVDPALASYRVLLILLFSAAYVRSTPARDSRAAIQRTVPGKPGQLLGMGVGLVFRFVPLLLADLRRIRQAMTARLGSERSVLDRVNRIGVLGLSRAFTRADRLSVALQARCFSWNPTLPALSFSKLDWAVCAFGAVLGLTAVL